MKVNGKEITIDEAIIYAEQDKLLLKHTDNGLLLNDYQLNVLDRNGFNINKYGNMQELLFDIEDYFTEEYDDELDLVSSQIAEFVYYRETKK